MDSTLKYLLISLTPDTYHFYLDCLYFTGEEEILTMNFKCQNPYLFTECFPTTKNINVTVRRKEKAKTQGLMAQ